MNEIVLNEHIFLIGFMGSGKSTIARRLSKMTGARMTEMDAELVERCHMSINEVFERYGEEYFRDRESELIEDIVKRSPQVVSCGGGAVLREKNSALMKEYGKIILLDARPETIYERVKNSKDRPILNGHMDVEYIASLMEKRRALYESSCDIRISTDGLRPDEIAKKILSSLN